jgi:hypothetical protein
MTTTRLVLIDLLLAARLLRIGRGRVKTKFLSTTVVDLADELDGTDKILLLHRDR